MTKPTTEDLAADLALCDAATPGPWVAWGMDTATSPMFGDKAQVAGLPRVAADHSEVFLRCDAAFIARSRDGWPAAIRLAMAGQRFKAFVHAWLDGIDVPHDPDPEHTREHGCRISGRLQWLLTRAVKAEAERNALKADVLDDVAEYVIARWDQSTPEVQRATAAALVLKLGEARARVAMLESQQKGKE